MDPLVGIYYQPDVPISFMIYPPHPFPVSEPNMAPEPFLQLTSQETDCRIQDSSLCTYQPVSIT
jgi:hypothetical protein